MKTFWIKFSIDVSRNSGDMSHKYLLHGRLILSSLVWLQTKLDSTQSYYLNLFKIENMPNKNVEKVIKGSWSYASWYLLSLLDQFTLNDFSGQCNKSANMGGGGVSSQPVWEYTEVHFKGLFLHPESSTVPWLQSCFFFMAGLLKSSITYPRSRVGVGLAYVFLSKRKLSLTQSI